MSAPRLDYHALAPKAARAGAQFSHAAGSSLDKRLRELVNLRVSQINGCAFCIDMHWADLVKQGMDPRHINAVAGWREAARFFGDAERAALNWAEAVNAVPQRSPSDADGSMPRLPASTDASSDRMSPNRFSVTRTSNQAGCLTMSIAHESTSWWLSSTSG